MTRTMHASVHRSTKPRERFTLIEIVIVVLIIRVLSAVGAPRFVHTLHWHRADSAAKRVRADLELLRQHAISTSSTQTVEFSPATNDYTLPGLSDLDHSGQTTDVDLASYRYHATLLSASIGGDSSLQFDRYGQPDSAGTITVQSGAFQQTVAIDPDTEGATIP